MVRGNTPIPKKQPCVIVYTYALKPGPPTPKKFILEGPLFSTDSCNTEHPDIWCPTVSQRKKVLVTPEMEVKYTQKSIIVGEMTG